MTARLPRLQDDSATWALLEQLAAGCYCGEHNGDDCPGGDCDGCLPCPSGRARAILALADEGERIHDHARPIVAVLRWLVDDLTDAGEDANPETGEVYDSVTEARRVLALVAPKPYTRRKPT